MKKFIDLKNPLNVVYLVLIAASIITMIVLLAGYEPSQTTEPVNTATPVKRDTGKEKVLVTVNVETISEGLNDMGFLVTQEYTFTEVETYTKEKEILNFFNSTSQLIYKYDGAVTAGVDFDKITITKDEGTHTLKVQIPKSHIQTVTIYKDSFEVYEEKESLWNPLNLEDYNDSMSELEDAARQKAVENGILERSDKQAEELIDNFISNFPSASGYEIEFEWVEYNP